MTYFDDLSPIDFTCIDLEKFLKIFFVKQLDVGNNDILQLTQFMKLMGYSPSKIRLEIRKYKKQKKKLAKTLWFGK